MKISALIPVFILFPIFVTDISATTGGSSVNVKINNKINSGISTFRSTSNTKVDIHQEGEGTSQVTINGQEWKLNGPGDINVNQNSSPTPNTPSPNPTQIPTPTPESVTPTATLSPTPTETPQEDDSPNLSISEILKARFEAIRESIEKFFFKIFGN